MSQPVIVSIPHKLGREEALRRIKGGFEKARTDFSALLTISDEVWSGNRLTFSASALGQHAAGVIDVGEADVRLELTLSWLLAKIAEKIVPYIRREGTLLLEKPKS
jgi:hypothetical protein